MRKTLLTLALIGLLTIPVLAQFPNLGGMMGGAVDAATLIANKGVQDELKLTDDQKKAVTEAGEAFQKAFREAIQEKDFSGIGKANEERTAALKKVIDKLDAKQTKRLMQIEVQVATKASNPRLFTSEAVQKALKLTDKQKTLTKETLSEIEKDVKELMEDAQGDFKKFGKIREKMTEMNKESFTKVTKSFDEDQKKVWETLGGEKFDYVPENPFGGFGKGKDKGKKKKDDF